MGLALVIIGAVAGYCESRDQPGQVDYRGVLTVINRTEAQVTVTSAARSFTVPACAEKTEEDFPLNWWSLTSRGRDTFHSGGGDEGPHSYLVVTSFVSQQDHRPDPLPPCQGLLQAP